MQPIILWLPIYLLILNNMSRKYCNNPSNSKMGNNTLRIIGGCWRSRKLRFINAPNLRPTPDSVRETLFNWLQGSISNARCLDLFAGSGALGLEALSRGATEVIFIEKHRVAVEQLKQNLALLKANNPIINKDAKNYLREATQPFDIIFLDPPFRKNFLPDCLDIIIEKQLLNDRGLLYLEQEAETNYHWEDWQLTAIKETKAGQVKSYLLKYKE
jgi:16S rRNA (guanine966-N2)-methyltransferase